MKYTPDEKALIFKIAAYSGLGLAAFLFVLMVVASEDQWRMNGPLYMLGGVLGYFTMVFLGMVIFLRMEVKDADGLLRRVTVWEILGYALLGGVMSKLFPYIESTLGLSGPVVTIIAVIVLLAIVALLYFRYRSKAVKS